MIATASNSLIAIVHNQNSTQSLLSKIDTLKKLYHLQLLFLSLALLALAGCQDNLASGHGVVQFTDGEPVRSGGIEFRSLDDGQSFASRIDPDGKFQLISSDEIPGIPAGEYEVVVVQIVLTEDLAAEKHTHGRTVPRRYADYYTSGLKASVALDDESPIQIHLEDN